jgi:hypothetical protein
MSCSKEDLLKLLNKQKSLNKEFKDNNTSFNSDLQKDLTKANNISDLLSSHSKLEKTKTETSRNLNEIKKCENSLPSNMIEFSVVSGRSSGIKKINVDKLCAEGGTGCGSAVCSNYPKSKCAGSYELYYGIGIAVTIIALIVIYFVFIK